MRTFKIIRNRNVVGSGAEFDNGRLAAQWLVGDKPESMSWYACIGDFLDLHNLDHNTSLEFSAYGLNQYLEDAIRTYRKGSGDLDVIEKGAMCIAGEAGELANYVKKVLWHGHALDRKVILDECGDILWYIATTLHGIGYDLEGCARYNIEKLNARYPNGFSENDSINRRE